MTERTQMSYVNRLQFTYVIISSKKYGGGQHNIYRFNFGINWPRPSMFTYENVSILSIIIILVATPVWVLGGIILLPAYFSSRARGQRAGTHWQPRASSGGG